MAKRNQITDTTEQVAPFLEEGSLEPETEETSLDEEDPLKKKKKKAAKKRAAKKAPKKAAVEVDEDGIELLADEDETPDTLVEEDEAEKDEEALAEAAPKPRKKKTAIVTEATTHREPTIATPAPTTVGLSAEDLLKTMTAAFDKTTTSLREIPVEIATSLEEARDAAEHRSSFVSKLTLALSAAACVLSLLAVGLAQSTRQQRLQVAAAAPVAVTRPAAPAAQVARPAVKVEPPRVLRMEMAQATAPAAKRPTANASRWATTTPSDVASTAHKRAKRPTRTRTSAPSPKGL